MSSEKKRPILAAFDFDGTLTYGDTLVWYLLYVDGPFKWLAKLLVLTPSYLLYLCSRMSRQELKERAATLFLKGKTKEEAAKLGEAFAREKLSRHVKPEGLARLQWHQQQGHRCVLISASPEIYLDPWGKERGMEVIATRLAVDTHGKLTGKIEGLNCREAEKVRRLKEEVGSLDNFEIYAYGNSCGDKELLSIAHHPFYREMPS